MSDKIKKDGFYLYDAAGQAYHFASEDEVKGKRVGAGVAPGYSIGQETAPQNWQEIAQKAHDMVAGRHLGSGAPYDEYHTNWEEGPLLVNDPVRGVYGWYWCVHRHVSPYNGRAVYDPSYGMIPW